MKSHWIPCRLQKIWIDHKANLMVQHVSVPNDIDASFIQSVYENGLEKHSSLEEYSRFIRRVPCQVPREAPLDMFFILSHISLSQGDGEKVMLQLTEKAILLKDYKVIRQWKNHTLGGDQMQLYVRDQSCVEILAEAPSSISLSFFV